MHQQNVYNKTAKFSNAQRFFGIIIIFYGVLQQSSNVHKIFLSTRDLIGDNRVKLFLFSFFF